MAPRVVEFLTIQLEREIIGKSRDVSRHGTNKCSVCTAYLRKGAKPQREGAGMTGLRDGRMAMVP